MYFNFFKQVQREVAQVRLRDRQSIGNLCYIVLRLSLLVFFSNDQLPFSR